MLDLPENDFRYYTKILSLRKSFYATGLFVTDFCATDSYVPEYLPETSVALGVLAVLLED